MNFIEIQTWPEVPQIAFFSSLFSRQFNLPQFDIEDLEEALLLDSSENNTIADNASIELANPRLIPDLIVSLLKGCDLVSKSWANITASNYQMFLRRVLRNKCESNNIENPFDTDVDFHSLPLRTKVLILNYLCEFRLDSADVEVKTNKLEADSLRIHPVGYDSNDSTYWYFYGTRLYREDIRKSKANSSEHIWQVICFTEDDWHTLANKFQSSKSRKEQNLYKCLVEDFLPTIPYLFKVREAERRRRLFQRRTSSRVKSLVEQRKANLPLIEDDSHSDHSRDDAEFIRLSYNERFLKIKKREQENRIKNREKIQQDRAIRAQRRRSYESSSSGISSNDNINVLNSNSDELSLLASNQINSSRSNKENIFTRFNSYNVFTTITTDKDKMPPVTTKLPGRQTNNSLSSMTGNIMIESTAPPVVAPSPVPSTSSRKKKTKAESYLETDEVLQIGMHKVLQYVKNHDDAWPFMDPVEEEIAPRYYSIIKRPMDLLKMEEKLDNGEYLTYTDFRTDFKLIVNNCRLYNGQNNEYTQMVNNLQIAFDRATKKYFDQSSSDEELVLLEYPPVVDVTSKTKRKIPSSADENTSKSEDVKNTKYSKKETITNSVSDKKSAKKDDEKVTKKQNKNSVNKLESTAKNTKRKKDKEKDKDKSNQVKKVLEHTDDSDNNDREVKIESPTKTKNTNKTKNNKKQVASAMPIKEEKISKKLSGGKKKIKGKEKEKIEKKLPKSYNKKAKNNKKIGNGNKKSAVEADIKSEDALKDDSAAYTDFSSDESIRDLINESFTKTSHAKKEKEKHSKKSKLPKESKKGVEKSSKQIKKNKHKISTSKLTLGYLDEDFNKLLSNRDKEMSPALLSMDSNDTNTFSDLNKSSTSFEIKDKFDLIKERRNQEKNLLKEKNNISKASKKTSKNKALEPIEKHEHKEKEKEKVKDTDKEKPPKEKKSKKEPKSLFDELLEDRNNEILNKEKKSSSSKHKEEKGNKLVNQGLSSPTSIDEINASKKKSSKQKASLDDLDLETEQTLKDINKWLEHTPRFEYNSESNSPSRYTIEDMDVHLKSDNNDFRKPIPLMPSSPPSTSKKNLNSASTTFQNVQIKSSDNFSKDTDSSCNVNKDGALASANLANQKKFAKISKKKLLGDKHPIALNKKREIQRTTNRLQPGKTKGNLLSNLQNVIKPDEYIPLGNKEKVKEIKNALTTVTDENSPKLNLGKVLDPSAFNFSNSGLEKEEPLEHKINDRISDDDNELSDKEQKKKDAPEDEQSENSLKAEPECSNTNTATVVPSASTTNPTETNAKPNLSAWFKAFGVSKKPSVNEADMKKDINKIESNIPQRRLSTGSSVSEISSVESSPHISMEDRSAPAPFPSPISASPISAISPKLDDIHKTNYPDNGPMRVGFYQDTTSTKSSPEKTGSPQEPLSSPYQQYPQQSNVYSSQSSNVYSNFYNPESSSSNKQHHSSSNSPLYYDQYKTHFNQETNMHKTMNASVSPSSSHHSQQSSPYQQQPNSPYPPTPDNMSSEIQSTNSGGNNNNTANNSNPASNNNIQSPGSTYSQSNSPYHQHPTSPYHSQQQQQQQQQPLPTNTNFNSQITPNQNSMFDQQQEVSQFSPNPQQQPHNNASQKAISSSSFVSSADIRQTSQPSSAILNPASMQHSNFPHGAKPNEALVQPQLPHYPGEQYVANDSMRSKKMEAPVEGTFSGPSSNAAPQQQFHEDTRRQAAVKPCVATSIDERSDNPKYLDLSKQSNRFPNQYQVPSTFPQPLDLDFAKNKAYDAVAAARNLQKSNNYPSSLNNCQLPNESLTNASSQQKMPPAAMSTQHDISKDNPKPPSITNFMQNTPSLSGNADLMSSHQARSAQASAIDINYKQNPLFNSSSASSMMELTAFMRDFRQAEDRYGSISNPSTNYYDKTNLAHMFSSKNAPQSSAAASNFQQIYSNPMTTIAYGREQQDFSSYQSRLNIFQANNTNQMMNANQQASVPPPADTKSTKKQKKKKTAEVPVPQAPSSLSQHQLAGTNQQQAHQQYVHQQPFQSFPGIKVPSGTSTDSSLSIKSVVPGSAFNYGPPTIPGLYPENSPYLDEFRGTQNAYYSQTLRSAESIDKSVPQQPPQAHPTTPSNPYHHLLQSHHPSRSYPYLNSIDPATLQQQYRMMFNQSYQAGYLGMHQQHPHWPMQ